MTNKVLIVDDDPNVLKAYERRLRKKFTLETALCSEEGVTAVNFLGPFAVVVSDMMMPRENGAEFLARILQTAPDSVRIMLTGNADQATAAEAINKGRVFRFLNKPCEADELEAAIREGIEEHRRLVAEKELLSGTLLGAVDLLSKVLSLSCPEAFGRSTRLKKIVADLAAEAGWTGHDGNGAWRHEAAALLSQIGYVAVPSGVLKKSAEGQPLTPNEAEALASHASVAGELIAAIPRLEEIARVVAAQDDPTFTDEQLEEPDGPRSSVAFGVRLLRLARDYDTLVHTDGHPLPQAMRLLEADADAYDAGCLEALGRVVAAHETRVLLDVMVDQLTDGMQIVEHVETEDGALLVAKGADVTPSLRTRLANYATTHAIREPLQVLVAAGEAEGIASAAVAT